MLIGHLAVPTILQHYFPLKLAPLYVGSVAPDVMDKGLQQMGVTVNGRNWAHNLFTLLITTTAIWMLKGNAAAKSWFIGYCGHLLCDADGFVPWFHPFATYKFYPSEKNLWQKVKLARPTALELFLVFWAIMIFFLNRKRRLNNETNGSRCTIKVDI